MCDSATLIAPFTFVESDEPVYFVNINETFKKKKKKVTEFASKRVKCA